MIVGLIFPSQVMAHIFLTKMEVMYCDL